MNNQLINIWEFEFFSAEENDNIETQYYTFSDSAELAMAQFEEDKPGVEYSVTLDGTITVEQMREWYGDTDLILDGR